MLWDVVLDGAALVVVGSRQPSQPGVSHVCVLDEVGSGRVVVMVGTGAAEGFAAFVDDVVVVVVVSSLQPNQPGVWHVVVVDSVDEEVVVVVDAEVVLSSRQPHQPGVLQVSVLVRVVELLLLVLVIGSLPLLSKNFQSAQSVHSTSVSQLGTVSYFSKTSLITFEILCVPMPTRHPRSPTVSYVHVWPV